MHFLLLLKTILMPWPLFHCVGGPVKLHSKPSQFGHLLQKLNVLLVFCLTKVYLQCIHTFIIFWQIYAKKHIERKISDTCKISCVTSKSKALFPALWLAVVSICVASLEVLMDEQMAVHSKLHIHSSWLTPSYGAWPLHDVILSVDFPQCPGRRACWSSL